MSSSPPKTWGDLARAIAYRVAIYAAVRVIIVLIEKRWAPAPSA